MVGLGAAAFLRLGSYLTAAGAAVACCCCLHDCVPAPLAADRSASSPHHQRCQRRILSHLLTPDYSCWRRWGHGGAQHCCLALAAALRLLAPHGLLRTVAAAGAGAACAAPVRARPVKRGAA